MSRQTELWLARRFDELYAEFPDPWRCCESHSSIDNELFLRMICAYRQTYSRALDVGCGLGVQSFKLAAYSGAATVGIDASEVAIQKAMIRYPEVKFHTRNIMTDDINDLGQFDLVVMSEVLWYVCDRLDSVLRKIANSMTADGVFAVHQYFPADQKYYRDVIDGMEGFKKRMDMNWSQRGLVVSHCSQDGPVMLALYQRR